MQTAPQRTGNDAAKYPQIRDRLAARLETMPPGHALPPERELAQEYGVARMTLRRALSALVADGLLVRRQGSGTFVAPATVSLRLAASSFTEDMRARGLTPGARTLAASMGPTSPEIAAHLEIDAAADVLRVRRLRLADGIPMATEDLHVPVALVPGLSADDLVEQSFYRVLKDRFGVEIGRGVQTIVPTVVSAEDAAALQVEPGAPAFRIERITRSITNQVVEYVDSVYRGDRYRLVVDIFPAGSSQPAAVPAQSRSRDGITT